MKITFAIETANKKMNLIQHDTKQIDRRVGKFKVHSRKFNHEAEWQRRWKQDLELQQQFIERFPDGVPNPWGIPHLTGILIGSKNGLVEWLTDEDLEDELVNDPDRLTREYTRKQVAA